MYIPVILGTAREGRQSEKVAKFLLAQAKNAGLESEIIDVRDYRIVATDKTITLPQAKAALPKIEAADGFIIVSPEYNHGYPGELKMFLDMFYAQWAKKPVGIAGVSISFMGGGRMVEQLRQVVVELHMHSIREALYFTFVQDLFNEKGDIKDPASFRDRTKAFFDELIWYAQTLKAARK